MAIPQTLEERNRIDEQSSVFKLFEKSESAYAIFYWSTTMIDLKWSTSQKSPKLKAYVNCLEKEKMKDPSKIRS